MARGTVYRATGAVATAALFGITGRPAAAQEESTTPATPTTRRRGEGGTPWAISLGVTSARMRIPRFTESLTSTSRGPNLSARYDLLSTGGGGRGVVSAYFDSFWLPGRTLTSEREIFPPWGTDRYTASVTAVGIGIGLRQHLGRRAGTGGYFHGPYVFGGFGLYGQRGTVRYRFTRAEPPDPYVPGASYDYRGARTLWSGGYTLGIGAQRDALWYAEIAYTRLPDGNIAVGPNGSRVSPIRPDYVSFRIGRRL